MLLISESVKASTDRLTGFSSSTFSTAASVFRDKLDLNLNLLREEAAVCFCLRASLTCWRAVFIVLRSYGGKECWLRETRFCNSDRAFRILLKSGLSPLISWRICFRFSSNVV